MAKKKIVEHSELEHSLAGPSGLKRLCNCEGSLWASKGIPEGEQNIEAARGERWHEWIEKCNEDPDKASETLLKILEVEPQFSSKAEASEMKLHTEQAYLYIQNLIRKFTPVRVDYELKLPCTYSPKDFGRGDVGMVYPRKSGKYGIVTIDWKYGRGVFVPEYKNEQMAAYADNYWKYIEKYHPRYKDVEIITTIVYQPRFPDDQGRIIRPFQYIETDKKKLKDNQATMQEFKDLISKIKHHVSRAYKMYDGEIEAVLTAGEHCIFCPAKNPRSWTDKEGKPQFWNGCRAYFLHRQENCPVMLDDINVKELDKKLNLTPVSELSTEELAKIALFAGKYLKPLEKYCKEVMAACKSHAETGRKVPGTKLVMSNKNRMWDPTLTDEEIAGELITRGLKEDPFEIPKPKLKSFGKIEKAMKTKDCKDPLTGLVIKPEGEPMLVLEDDPRPEVDVDNLLDDIN